MTKLLQKAFDEASKLPERNQDALASVLLDEIQTERRREGHGAGMPWQEIREHYPHQWLLLSSRALRPAYRSGNPGDRGSPLAGNSGSFLKLTEKEAGGLLRMTAAIKLFEVGRLSSGAAARRVGVPRVLFLSQLADYGVDTFRLTEKDLQKEARLA